ncbi:30S ribosomal protein S20 [Dissulfurirhabdus thermomarina]|uniref:Small ribosomal subunit protein bS20 n=1 Tax=Dissulfurirhabdus thermomarina TaxID=1765737 RepID=A0A6N9TP46_DISTH|nr:30S ribosomal protein S20 [Dissulfurirhabdus thermomarina]NDY43051.1 30S ribosomal protein S20 [Dissulfurirhabdus thermomarina]NMX22540.1 30S ribosomal protein S20 [Dissulfurirhabdus thermomarina]
MANHKSALKRDRQSKARRLRNKARKTRVKNLVKSVQAAIAERKPEEARQLLRLAQKTLDKTAAKGTIHWRAAARKVARLSRKVHALVSAG